MKFLLSSQDIQNYKFYGRFLKKIIRSRKVVCFSCFISNVYSILYDIIAIPIKIIIDYSAQAYNFPLDIRLPFNFLYLIVLAYAAAWLANELCNWTKIFLVLI